MKEKIISWMAFFACFPLLLLAQSKWKEGAVMPKNYLSCTELDETNAAQAIYKIGWQLQKKGIKKKNLHYTYYIDTVRSVHSAHLEIAPEDSDNFASIKISSLPFSGHTDSTRAFLFSEKKNMSSEHILLLELNVIENCLDVTEQIKPYLLPQTKGIILVTSEPDFVRKLYFHKPLSIPAVAIHPRDYTIISRWQQLENLLAMLSVIMQQESVKQESLRIVFKGKTTEKLVVMAACSGNSVSYDALLLAQVATILQKRKLKTEKTIELVFAQATPYSNYWLKNILKDATSPDLIAIILENTIQFLGWNGMGREDVEKFFKPYEKYTGGFSFQSIPVYCGNYKEIIESGIATIVHQGVNASQACCPACNYIAPVQDTYQLATQIADLLQAMAQDSKMLPKTLSQKEIEDFLKQHQLHEKLVLTK